MTSKVAAFQNCFANEPKKNRNSVADARNFNNNSPLRNEWGAVIENN